MANPLKPGYTDTATLKWAEYVMTTGVFRLLDIAESMDITVGSFINGVVAERWPEVVQRLVDAGHHIQAHSWAQDLLPLNFTREEEDASVKRCIAAFEACVGKRPRGYGGPRGTTSEHPAEILAANGFKWIVDYMNGDVPYLMETAGGPLPSCSRFTAVGAGTLCASLSASCHQ